MEVHRPLVVAASSEESDIEGNSISYLLLLYVSFE
jgi:hypothetical protein